MWLCQVELCNLIQNLKTFLFARTYLTVFCKWSFYLFISWIWICFCVFVLSIRALPGVSKLPFEYKLQSVHAIDQKSSNAFQKCHHVYQYKVVFKNLIFMAEMLNFGWKSTLCHFGVIWGDSRPFLAIFMTFMKTNLYVHHRVSKQANCQAV